MFSKLFNLNNPRIGYVFDDHPEFFDSQNNITKNIFTGEGVEGCDLVWDGTPTFRTDFGTKNKKSVRLDNTIRARFRNPIPAGGTIIIVGKATMGGSGTRSRTIIKGSTSTNPNLMMSLQLAFFSGQTKLKFFPSAGGLEATINSMNDNIHVAGLAIYGKTFEATTIFNGGNKVSNIDNNPSTVHGSKYMPSQARYWDFGYLNISDVDNSVLTDTYDIAAIFFLGENPVRDQETEVQELMEQINDYYGIY